MKRFLLLGAAAASILLTGTVTTSAQSGSPTTEVASTTTPDIRPGGAAGERPAVLTVAFQNVVAWLGGDKTDDSAHGTQTQAVASNGH